MQRNEIKNIVDTAILIAVAITINLLCGFIGFLNFPQGGQISPAMLPIIIIGLRCNWKYGIAGGLIYGCINILLDNGIYHWGSFFLDYSIPFSILGISGLFKQKSRNLWFFCLLILALCFIRYLCHSFSGIMFFKNFGYEVYAEHPEYFPWEVTGKAVYWVYSFIVYNLPYMFFSTILCIILGIQLHSMKLIFRRNEDIEDFEKENI